MTRTRKQIFSGSESRLQRLFITRFEFWGDAPGWDERAPLALKTNATADSLSAKGASFIRSLGQRPRIPGHAKSASPAAAGRFFLEMCP